MDASSLFTDIPLVAVVSIDKQSDAVPLANALYEAGIKAIEVTLRTEVALAAIESIQREVPEILLGAGSIRRSDQIKQVINAGARFAVSPGCSPALLEEIRAANLPFVPGAATASEMIVLLEQGYMLQKFFPAELSGGLAKIRALAAPLPEVKFFATGGINTALAREYLACSSVACIGGSWFVAANSVAMGDFKAISALAKETLSRLNG